MKERYGNEIPRWLRLLSAWRINKESIDFKWGYFAPGFGLRLMLHRGGYFDQRYAVSFCLIWGSFYIKLPFKTRIPESCDTPQYGFTIFDSTLMMYFGGKMNDWEQCDSILKTWDLPFFSWQFDHHLVRDKQGEWVSGDGAYDNPDVLREEHPYQYVLKSGEIQHRMATIYAEERQWHRKWWPFSKMVHKSIDVAFDDEVGERSGSWKGGTIGCGYDQLPGETMKATLQRMEREREFN